ncbi:MAG TPA: amidohydrolase [Vicinamibacterales bacterium]|nr:amidohydrolase [Vicinamibacterales bacterium]
MRRERYVAVMLALMLTAPAWAQTPAQAPAAPPDSPRLTAQKQEAVKGVDELSKLAQEMVDSVFSFGELGMQEVETSKYLTGQLEKFGFKVARGQSGIPTAWVATWGSGKPVIALGSDIDGIPQASQKPGVAYHDPIVTGAPGHGEGHNTGMPLNIVAAIAVKKIMERDKLPGTIMIWPGVAEELVASKAWFVRDGIFKDVDVNLFTHVGANLGVSWGQAGGTGLVSVEYTFEGETAHSAGAPWRGRSALDAVELMSVGWQYRREHLRLSQRSHSVITNGGDQPNVVPRNASIWFYFREIDQPHIKELWDVGNQIAEGAALMTNTTWSSRILGTAYPRHFNKTVAETMYANVQKVGLPEWSEADQTLAKALQKELGNATQPGLADKLGELGKPLPLEDNYGGGSDDIGDISWNMPTVTLSYPSNIPGLPGHNWSSAIASATPIAHKGVVAGAKVQAMTILDLLTKPELVTQAWDYYNNVQTKDVKYIPFITRDTPAPTHLNTETLAKYREQMRKYYYDPTRYPTYLQQLGITYPTVRTDTSKPQQER